MKDYKKYFKDKKITVMGLGLLGGALNDVIFLAEQGAKLVVTDLKTSEELAEPISKLKSFGNIKFVLGEHKLEDFCDADLILQPGNVPTDSPFLLEAKKNNIPIHVSESLFAMHTEGMIVGVTGTRGKSTVTEMIFHTLKSSSKMNSKVFLGGNVKNVSTLSLLSVVNPGDFVILELDSWALHGMGDVKISPHISVFTTFMPDHLNYYKNDLQAYFSDKANIFKYQDEKDFLIMGDRVVSIIDESFGLEKIKSKKISASLEDFPPDWKLKIPGEHNKYNAVCAMEALKVIGLTSEEVKNGLESFAGVSGRLELVKEINGVKIYNDTNSTTPDATRVGLKALAREKNIILIMGGADKGIDMSKLISVLPEYCKKVILIPGTGTDKIKEKISEAITVTLLSEAVKIAIDEAISGDIILFSPGFASFGPPPSGFKNEYDRGDKFNAIINSL